MIRAVAGVLHRSGAPDDAVTAVLRHAVTAEAPGSYVSVQRSGALAVACSGGDPYGDGVSLAVLDGLIDDGLGAGGSDDVLGPDHGRRLERAALENWRGRDEAFASGLRGDHALLLWDGARGVLIRDQIGGRSWVIHDDGARLLFATEVGVLLRVLATRPVADDVTMAHWLGLSGIPADRTMYEGVRRLESGNLLELDPSSRRAPRRYWSPAPPGETDRRTFDEAADELRGALQKAVTRRCAGSAITGISLSGGLDSATVAGIATTLPSALRPRRAYSAVFPSHRTVDEDELIAEVADDTGLARTSVVVGGGSVVAGGLSFLERWALPPSSPNLFFWLPLVERAGEDGIRVMLDGEGGDELFGLSPYLVADRLARGNLRGAVATVRRVTGGSPDLDRRVIARFIREYGVAGLAPAWAHAISRRLHNPLRYVPPWISPHVARTFVETTDGAAWKRHGGPRWWNHLVESTIRGMGPAMVQDQSRQRGAMGGHIPRHPIHDVDVVELVLRSAPELSFDPARSRPVVRQAIKGLVPDSVRLRPDKSTFDEVFHESIASRDRPLLTALLADPAARVGAYTDLGAVRAHIDSALPTDGHERMLWGLHTWRLVTAELFLRFQEDEAAPRRAVEAAGPVGDDVVIRVG